MKKPKVFLTGGDGIGWALDEDMKLTRQAMRDIVDFVDLPDCEVVHLLWWEGLTMIPLDQLIGKRVVCHVPGEPFRYLSLPRHRLAFPIVGKWVTRTSQAAAQLRSIGIVSHTVPYLIDVDIFRPLPPDDKDLLILREQWGIPKDAYLIGNFHRDTEGADLRTPKLVKGPDLLLEIFLELRHRGLNIHVVLAGPRRHWLLGRMEEEKIPFTYIGRRHDEDDIAVNFLPRPQLNTLYNIIDLYIVPSRSEGGPHAILEAAAAGCKIISTPVGMAKDVLHPASIFSSMAQAIDIIGKDMQKDFLGFTRDLNSQRVAQDHCPKAATSMFSVLYDTIDAILIFPGKEEPIGNVSRARTMNHLKPINETKSPSRKITVGLWHKFFQPPYGGGNQFMMALRKAFLKRGIDVRENELHEDIDAYVLNSIHFDVDRFLDFGRDHRLNVIHRIDGPIHLIRGYDRDKDELCYRLNDQFASATVLQSAWTYQRIVELGYSPVAPVIIHNAIDSDIFHPHGRISFDPDRKIRLISTSWSNNPRKGGPTYKWIEDHLDWDRFEYTFVGNASEKFDRIRHIPPVSSEELAHLLRAHDIYITASRNDPCSNALIEAMACGLPALYFNDGGHPELVGYGGLPFNSEEEILSCLENLVEQYESFQRLISVSSLDDAAEKYLVLIREIIQ